AGAQRAYLRRDRVESLAGARAATDRRRPRRWPTPARAGLSEVTLHIASPEQMRELGEALGSVAEAGDRFLLEGPFGAGKTTFVQGLARGLGVETAVGSPSFVIETQYRGRLRLYHIDLYRLERIEPELQQELEEDL